MPKTKDPQSALKKKIKLLCEKHPDLVISSLLETPFWPAPIRTDTAYERQHDDTDGKNTGFLEVCFLENGDAVITIGPQALRFRNWSGGGLSLRTYTALAILAVAMNMDNELPRL